MKRNKLFMICLLLSSLLILSSSVSAQEKPKDYVQGVTKDEIVIGSNYALTGPAAYFGLSLLQATELYFNEVNVKGGVYGRKIRIISEDDACTPIKGVAAVNKLLADKPFMILGFSCSGVALACLETIVREGIPVLSSVTTPKIYNPLRRNIFRAGTYPDDLQAKAVVDYDIYNLKARKIAIIHDTSEYGKGGKDGIVERLNEFGLKPIAIEAMNLGDTDMTTQILKLREAKPEVVHVYSYAKEAAILARQAKELGLNAQLILSGATTVPAFLETAGDGATGVLNFYHHPYLADSPHPLVVDLTNKLKASYRLPPGRPNYTDFTGYGFGMIVVEALQRAGKNVTWEKFISAMETIKNFNGGGYLLPTTFSSTDHNGQKSGRFLVVLPGKKWSVIADDVYPREKVEKVE